MKTPDEIKKGLFCCWEDGCATCPYDYYCTMEAHFEQLAKDSLDYINQLESCLAQVERERDGMATFIKSIDPLSFSIIPVACRCCKNHDGNFTKDKCAFCQTYGTNANWEWRGLCEENTHDQPSM